MSFTSTLSGLDFTIPELPARDVMFRIYRDTRFSKNPTPYKVSWKLASYCLRVELTYIASLLCCVVSPIASAPRYIKLNPKRSRTGRKGPFACYYIHAEPGNCFMGGGLYHPENDAIHKLRESIDERPRRWRRILNEPDLKKQFLPSAAKNPKPEAALKAFANRNQENALKTKPKVTGDRLPVSICVVGVTDIKCAIGV